MIEKFQIIKLKIRAKINIIITWIFFYYKKIRSSSGPIFKTVILRKRPKTKGELILERERKNNTNKKEKRSFKFYLLVLNISLVTVIFPSFAFLSMNAKPGELFFTSRIVSEKLIKKVLRQNDTEHQLYILNNRISSIDEVKDNCFKLYLAENEILSHFKLINHANLTDDNILKLSDFKSRLKTIYKESTCRLRADTAFIPDALIVLYYKRSGKLDTLYLENELITSKARYTEWIHFLENNEIDSQAKIAKLTDLILELKSRNSNATELLANKDFFNASLELLLIDSILNNLESESDTVEMPRDYLQAFCNLSSGERCAKEQLDSTWNSILEVGSISERYKLANQILFDYAKLIADER